jgi:pimeloyl-ACP methyl ester carboxylesterase
LSTAATLRQRLAAAVGDPEFQAMAALLALRVRFACGASTLDLVLPEGPVEPAGGAADITIRADERAWVELMAAAPRPGFQSFTAFQLANPAFAVTGDPLVIAQARAALERLTELLRAAPYPAPPSSVARDQGQITGRYLAVESGGAHFEIFVEEAGSGIPLVMLHTAGADSRQFHALLADVELARRFRLTAFDLPFHGRSLPPGGWDGGAYRLDQATYARWVEDCLAALDLGPVILMGCSMGAAITLVMAARRPDLLRAAIALEPPLRSPGRRSPYLAHPAVNAGLHNPAYVKSLMAPTSPLDWRRRAAWIYAQAAPGIYSGDLAFYSDEFDAATVAPAIDTRATPLTLMTGEYDYSATPADGERIAAMVEGARFIRMPGLGHFPMTENPDRFRGFLLPVLDGLSEA